MAYKSKNLPGISRSVFLAGALSLVGLNSTFLVGCGGAHKEIKTDPAKPESWTKKTVWTEGEFVMVVGRASDASLDEASAMDTAGQDAREQMALYLNNAVIAFRQSLSKKTSIKGKSADADPGEKPKSAAELTNTELSGGQTIAAAAVRGLEIINSEVNKETDTQYVLGRLNIAALRKVMAQSNAFTEEERARIEENAEEVRVAMGEALMEAKSSK